ncbi:sigma-70 family RNA polymerase sigma factor [Chitinophaga qingshengii]|uniref:Sigma-70 family RNA polymerase sigma factor n=1 Tax=Chitinophaga qingshengii TaxID=1569794 RepID=A0ABR7TH59_9BACT|nr:sigma-70 family RNA polymerase sigma factor [Chitinophaga qingshengii]MBC9928960.1 sigma-70 family RNA polymerase sigma factor [Chitinophaga qingshengii]
MSIQAVHNEALLLAAAAKGDEKAFAALFHAYYNQLGEFVYRIVDSRDLAADIVQDVFTKIWLMRGELPLLDSFTGYLFVLTRNYTYNCLKKIARDRRREELYAEMTIRTMPGPVDNEYLSLLERAVAQLPAQQQQVYMLSRLKGLKHKEIAALLGLSTETVRKYAKLAIRSVTRFMRAHAAVLLLLTLKNHS